jgi:hypothetical protein
MTLSEWHRIVEPSTDEQVVDAVVDYSLQIAKHCKGKNGVTYASVLPGCMRETSSPTRKGKYRSEVVFMRRVIKRLAAVLPEGVLDEPESADITALRSALRAELLAQLGPEEKRYLHFLKGTDGLNTVRLAERLKQGM